MLSQKDQMQQMAFHPAAIKATAHQQMQAKIEALSNKRNRSDVSGHALSASGTDSSVDS